jgi:two-component system alkaline phosphatase synthesis response regulator PhoP
MTKVLIVEDDEVIAQGMAAHLAGEGFDPIVVARGEQGLARLRYESPDVCVLDLMLPERDGWSLIETARSEGIGTPIVVVSARGAEHDRVHALEIGADDYLVKPFSVRELVTRIKALLRRAYGELADTHTGRTLRRGDLVIDLERRRVTRDGERIGLTTTEFDLLRHLASRPGRVYTRAQLLELVRDYDDALEQDERTINVHISHIRDKVEPDPSQPRYIRTVRGVGYAFAED